MALYRRFVAPVFWGLIAATLYWVCNAYKLNDLGIEVSEYYGEQFFAVLATLYAIITALVLVKGLESFTALEAAIHKEAMKIRSLNAYLMYFTSAAQPAGDSHVIEIRRQLIAYATNVLDQRSASQSSKNDRVIDSCVRETAGLVVADENDRAALTEIMHGFDALRTLRANRVNVSQERIPDYMIVMLAFMTITIIIPFYLHQVEGLSFNYYAVFVLATFGSFIFFLLNDINRPYEGLWTINFEPFVVAREEIAETFAQDVPQDVSQDVPQDVSEGSSDGRAREGAASKITDGPTKETA